MNTRLRNLTLLLVLLILCLTLTGCGNKSSNTNVSSGNPNAVSEISSNTNNVQDLLKSYDKNSNKSSTDELSNSDNITNEDSNIELESDDNNLDSNDNNLDYNDNISFSNIDNKDSDETINADFNSNIDVDLTALSSNMVYAEVYQMMVTPEDYVGKTIKMSGQYYASYYEPTNQYYHCVIISDATACCSQGIEFLWDNGTHVYPDEYPEDYTEVEVTGVFETYTEDGDSNLYCRIITDDLIIK